jgi:transcriptional regulator with XRE-family HTH domain
MSRREDKSRAFGKALTSARLARGLTQRALGELLGGTTQSAISAWEAGEAEPLPATVFAVEEMLGLAGGALSRALGYLPAGEGGAASSVAAAIAADPLLGVKEKRGLLALYEELTRRRRAEAEIAALTRGPGHSGDSRVTPGDSDSSGS